MSDRGSWLARPISKVLCKFVPINCAAKISVVRSRAKQPFGRRTRQSARRPTSQRQLPLLQTRRADWEIRRRAPPSERRRSGTCARASAPPQVGRLSSPERASVASQLDLSLERVSAARSAVRPALDQSVRLNLRPPALDRGAQPDLSPEHANVVPSVAPHPELDQSVRPDLSLERVSAARSAVRPALDQSVRLNLRPPALDRSVQPDLSPERANVVPSVARPAPHRSVQPDLSPERVSAVPSVARLLALDRSVQLDLRPLALDRRASGVESDKRGWVGALLEGRHQPQCTETRGDSDVPNELRVCPLLAQSRHP